jgi:(1->4)-alpha-D-glucan 1-alpha-D-glucosylmutase
VVEKILSGDERLPEDWPVAGTTGYEFANEVLGLLIAPEGLVPLERLRAEMTGEDAPFPAIVDTTKRLVLDRLFPGEHKVLAEKAAALLELSEADVAAALTELLVAFPVYRTYRRDEPLRAADRAVLERIFKAAGERLEGGPATALAGLRTLIESDLDRPRQAWVTGLQQLSGPVMAKALEDTAFYRFPRLLALNEVGGEPDAHGLTPEDFHARNAARLARWPHTMLATATHDTKRGEDARMRLAVLSELPELVAETVRGWRAAHAGLVPKGLHPKDAYTLYQAFIGVWPLELAPDDRAGLTALNERVKGYIVKALREAKERSDWADPDEAYEALALSFVERLLDPSTSDFTRELAALVARLTPAGEANGLAQLLIKLTAPGVPDIYQGTEAWDLSKVDPDNRRPVDWNARRAALDRLDEGTADCKLQVMARTLALRRSLPDLFAAGDYLPLSLEGPLAAHGFAFARRRAGQVAITLVGRHLAGLLEEGSACVPTGRWADTALRLPEGLTGTLTDRLTGARPTSANGRLALRDALIELPVALLVADGEAGLPAT